MVIDNNNGAEWCRHIKIKGLVLEIEIDLILTLDGIASCLIKGLVLALDIVQGLILDLCPRSCS